MSGGRPSLYQAEYCDAAREFLKDGYSLAAFAGHIGVSRQTVYEWQSVHPEFSDAIKAGQAAAVLWWENAARNLATGGEGNATAVIFGLKNRAADEWRDKVETEHSGEINHKVTRVEIVGVEP